MGGGREEGNRSVWKAADLSRGRMRAQLALVGAPNVGKSSLVQILSSGTPEVCNYPFTTRSIKMGHFFVDGRRHQVLSPNLAVTARERG